MYVLPGNSHYNRDLCLPIETLITVSLEAFVAGFLITCYVQEIEHLLFASLSPPRNFLSFYVNKTTRVHLSSITNTSSRSVSGRLHIKTRIAISEEA